MSAVAPWPELPPLPAAACRGMDPNIFYPQRGESSGRAKKVCAGCRHQLECRDYALEVGEPFGVWGGLTPSERQAVRRSRRLAGGMTGPVTEVEAAANGHADLVDGGESISVGSPSSMPEALPASSDRVCVGCGQPLTGPHFKKWCNQSCRSKHRDHAGEKDRRRTEALNASVTADTAPVHNPSPVAEIADHRKDGPGVATQQQTGRLLAALGDAGLCLERLELVDSGGRHWELRPL